MATDLTPPTLGPDFVERLIGWMRRVASVVGSVDAQVATDAITTVQESETLCLDAQAATEAARDVTITRAGEAASSADHAHDSEEYVQNSLAQINSQANQVATDLGVVEQRATDAEDAATRAEQAVDPDAHIIRVAGSNSISVMGPYITVEGHATAANLIINAECQVNQSEYVADTPLAIGGYAFDIYEAVSADSAMNVVTAGQLRPKVYVTGRFRQLTSLLLAYAGRQATVSVEEGDIAVYDEALGQTVQVNAYQQATITISASHGFEFTKGQNYAFFAGLNVRLGLISGRHSPQHYTDELRRVQHYYWKPKDLDGLAYNIRRVILSGDSGAATDTVFFPVPMRAVPEVSYQSYNFSISATGVPNQEKHTTNQAFWEQFFLIGGVPGEVGYVQLNGFEADARY